jgi:hypothetical protein
VRHGSGRWARFSPIAAWSLAGCTVIIVVAAMVLLGLNAKRMGLNRIAFDGTIGLAVVVYAGVGRLIADRVPHNAIGWLLGLMGLSLGASVMTEQYAVYGLATAPGSLPAARLAGWAADLLVSLTVLLLFFVVLLFPDGRLPSRRWRPVFWAVFVVVAGAVAQQLQVGIVTGGLTNALAVAKVTYPNPLGILPSRGWFSVVLAVTFFCSVITAVLVVASVFVRRRGASVERRQQIAWLGYVGLVTILWAVVLAVISAATNGNSGLPGTLSWIFMALTALVGVPLACGVAVLKYRLYEIERVISRTLAYAIVTGLLIGVYAGLVLLATHVLSVRSPVAVAAATLAAAALFTPLRSRVQMMVDRKFNRSRYDAEQTVAAFAARLQDAVDPDAVRADLLGVVQRSLEPVHVSAWLGPRLSPGTLILNEEWEHRLYAERDLAVLEARRLDITSDGQSLRWPMRRGQSFP